MNCGSSLVSTLYDVSHHSFEISQCNFGPEVIATTSVIPMSPGHNLRIHVRVRAVFCLLFRSRLINISGVKPSVSLIRSSSSSVNRHPGRSPQHADRIGSLAMQQLIVTEIKADCSLFYFSVSSCSTSELGGLTRYITTWLVG